MKILMTCPRFSPRSGGGGYVIAKNLCKALIKNGHEVVVLTSDHEFDWKDGTFLNAGQETWLLARHDGVPVIPLTTDFTISSLHITHKDFSRYGDRIVKHFDIIHMQGCRTWQNIQVAKLAQYFNVPYIVDAHGFPIQGTIFHKLILKTFDRLFANKIVQGASKCIAETEVGKQEYLRTGIGGDKIDIIPCPYDLSVFDKLPSKGNFRQKYGILPKTGLWGFLGGLDHVKGLDLLIEAFALRKTKTDGKKTGILVLAGTDMGFKRTLDKLIIKFGLKDDVIFTGYIAGQDKLEFLVDCDVCVFPSRAEQGLPFAALESLMCGTPIIVTQPTGMAEDVNKMNCGFIVDFGDKEKLAWLMDYTLSDGAQPLVNKLIQNGQEYIRKNLALNEQVKRYERIYEGVLKQR
jgi:glycosyltransferase involved in cell wall biosynthesis